MENFFRNVTFNSSEPEGCMDQVSLVVLSLLDIIPLLLGQPVVAKLLWITITSKKATDILNSSFALFHSVQYLLSTVHLFFLFLLPDLHTTLLRFLLTYTEIGGPMSLSFICMERFIAVIYPTFYPLLKKYRFREVCVATVWLLSVPTAFFNVFTVRFLGTLRPEMFHNLLYIMLVLMTSMVMHCSISIARTLKKSGPGKEKLHPVKKRAFKTVCATSVIVWICYTPVAVLQKVAITDGNKLDCVIAPVCLLLLSVASDVHLLFYLSAQGKLFTCLKKAEKAR